MVEAFALVAGLACLGIGALFFISAFVFRSQYKSEIKSGMAIMGAVLLYMGAMAIGVAPAPF